MKVTTKYGDLKHDAQGKIFWADNKVWSNWPELARDGILYATAQDGYCLELYLTGYEIIRVA